MSFSTAPLQPNQLFFGTPQFLAKFKEDVIAYCKSQNYSIDLTDAEIEHLSWHVGNTYQSPEAGKNTDKEFNHIPFEVKRSIARCYSFDLLLRGKESDYREFVNAHDENTKLSYSRFQALSSDAKKLDKDSQVAIRASGILVMSNQLRKICNDNRTDELRHALRKNNLSETLSNDSEEFLSQFAILASMKPELTPITQILTQEQNELLKKVFWPNLHMRWLYSTEGGNNMTNSLVEAIKEHTFNQERDLPVWAWRWRLNVAGFQGGPGAKFYDSVSDQLIENTLTELNKLFINPSYQFLHNYLLSNARAANLVDNEGKSTYLTSSEAAFLGHLIAYLAYFHRIDIFSAENSRALVTAYNTFKQEFPEQKNLADNYVNACGNEYAVTPTYVPGALDTALGLFKSHVDTKNSGIVTDKTASLPSKIDSVSLFKIHPENAPEAVYYAVKFMCQLLSAIYKTPLSQRISCMTLAKTENLKSVLELWLKNPNSVLFGLTDKMELMADCLSEARMSNQYTVTPAQSSNPKDNVDAVAAASSSTSSTQNNVNKQHHFPIKGQESVGIIELIRNPNQIDKDTARSVLVDSFIGEYEKYLSPSDIRSDLISWRDGDQSVRKYYEDYFKTELGDFSRGELHYWVQATIDGKLVGWATFQHEKSDQNAVYMNLLVVPPKFQGRGIGEQLVKSLVNLHEIPDLNAINLLLRKKNQGGRIFYSKLGFTSNPEYQREDNFVDPNLLEGLTWKNPSLQNKNAVLPDGSRFRDRGKSTLFKTAEAVAEEKKRHNTYCGFERGFLIGKSF